MKIGKILPLLLLLVTLTACRSSKSVTEGGAPVTQRVEEQFKKKIVANAQRAKCVTARINMELDAMGKQVAIGGKLRMKRDEVVQLSLSLLGFEIGRMDFRPHEVLVLDRVNKQFVRASYEDIAFLRASRLDFYALQSLFWNEVFIPGERDATALSSRLEYVEQGNHVLLNVKDAPKLDYKFLAQLQPAVISQVNVAGKGGGSGARLTWDYDNFVRLDNRYFPSVMKCEVAGLDKNVGFTLQLSRLDNDEKWSAETAVSSRYQERSVEEIFRFLMAM